MSFDFNVSHIPFRFFCDRLVSNNIANNLIIESSSNNIELNSNNRNFVFNNNAIFNYGINLQGLDLSNIQSITAKTLNINTLFLNNKGRSLTSIEDYGSIDDGYIRATTIGISGRSSAYFTYIDVSGGDSSFNNSAYIKNRLTVNGSTTISNDLFVNGTSFVNLYNAINNYIDNNRQQLVTAKVLTNDLSATNISISNELVVRNTSFLNDLSINGEMLNNVLKVPGSFTIDPSGHGNNSGTLIVNGDLMVYGNTTIIASSIFEISDVAISVASNLINKNDLSGNSAGLDISNVASLKYDGSTWNFVGGQLSVENKRVALDVSFIDFRSFSEASLNSLNNYFDLSYDQLKTNNDNSYNAIYSRSQIDNSFMLITQSSFDISYLRSYVDNSFVNKITFDGSFSALKTYLDASYIIKSTSTNLNVIDSSLIFLSRKLDLSYVSNSVFEGSFNKLKEQIELSFASVSLTSLDSASISVETINTKHYSQRFNNILWNQIGLDISNGPPFTNNKKVAISNDGKVVALSAFAPVLREGSGGTITISGGYVIHRFDYSGTFTPYFSGNVEVLLVGGGGGGGGGSAGGGGGGGGVIWIPATYVTADTSYNVEVGTGGASGTTGIASSVFTAIAAGGGTSGSQDSFGTNGGSGGGAGGSTSGVFEQGGASSGNSLGTNIGFIYGCSGGNMIANRGGGPLKGAGGGGAGAPGLNTNPNTTGDTGQTGEGSGGVGVVNAILGTSYYWAGGGGGGAYYPNVVGGYGGWGGGGGGATYHSGYGVGLGGGFALNDGSNGLVGPNTRGGAGGPNTGGGGGSGTYNGGSGGAGGSGIVVIRYLQMVSDISKGRIYVYELSYNQASYSWNQLGLSSEIIVGLSNDDQFGWDVALSSNGRVVAGSSIANDASGINNGQVRVYELSNNTNRWLQKGSNINGPRPSSESGYSISLAGSGNRIAIGAWKDNSNGTNAGAVRVYDFSATINDWRQQGQTIAGSLGSFEGYSTALSLDGQTLASASILEASRNIIGIGGTVSTSGGYIIHSFTAVGSYAFVPALSGNVEVLIVGGGGGGGGTGNNGASGGGGAGGVVYIPSVSVSAGTNYPIVIGAGGASGANGLNSSAFTAIAAGGGRGGLPFPTNGSGSGNNGGSGGGAGGGNITNIGGISSGNSTGTNSNAIIYGNNGGSMTSNLTDANRAAGGGGAGTKGFDTDTNSGGDGGQFGSSSGGDGIMYNILGPSYYWGGGGGGAGRFSIGGWGGRGGGGGGGGSQETNSGGPGGGSALTSGGAGNVVGSGSVADRGGGNGGNNTGGGGGGGSYNNIGGAGGSGIVIIRYLVPNISRGLIKTFTISGSTWTPKGNITGSDISFGRAIKLSGNGNTIVIGAPGYTNEYKITPIYELNTSTMNWQAHRTNALTVFGRDLAVILDASQNAQVNALQNGTRPYLGGRRTSSSINSTGKTSVDWEWVTGDVWNYTAFPSSQPDNTYETVIHMFFGDGGWNDISPSNMYTAVYMYYIFQPLNTNVGRTYVYGYQGGTTWTQLGQTIQGISGGDEFGSSVAISNDGSIVSIGSDNNSSNRGHVRVFAYANNYWNQVSGSISGKTSTSRAGIHALSGDGTTLIQSNNTYNSVYGINKTLAVNSPMTTISGNLIVLNNISVNSLDISTNHVYSSNGYSYKMFNSDISSAIMKEYYSDVTSTRHLKVQIRGDGNITNRNNSYRALSDSRLKENIVTSGPKLEDLLKVRVVDYTMKGASNTKYIGVLAQELEGHFPNLVTELEPSPKDIEEGRTLKYKAVNYSSFDAILIKSLQEQNAMLKNITQRIETLEEALEEKL